MKGKTERENRKGEKGEKMHKKTLMESLARESYEKGGFNGAWLYAEHGEIVSKGTMGFCDGANTMPLTEDTLF